MATLYYLGHASMRIVTDAGTVIYIDPAIGDQYDMPADLVLITHEHGDHNRLSLITQKPKCRVIRATDALDGKQYNHFEIGEIKVQAIPAGNKNHPSTECVGYLVTIDGIKLYHAGDTSSMPSMRDLAALHLDWAFLPTDGIYNMDVSEASVCAKLIGAKHSVPIHTDTNYQFNPRLAEQFDAPGRTVLEPKQSVKL